MNSSWFWRKKFEWPTKVRKAQLHERKIHIKFMELNKRKSLETSTIYNNIRMIFFYYFQTKVSLGLICKYIYIRYLCLCVQCTYVLCIFLTLNFIGNFLFRSYFPWWIHFFFFFFYFGSRAYRRGRKLHGKPFGKLTTAPSDCFFFLF